MPEVEPVADPDHAVRPAPLAPDANAAHGLGVGDHAIALARRPNLRLPGPPAECRAQGTQAGGFQPRKSGTKRPRGPSHLRSYTVAMASTDVVPNRPNIARSSSGWYALVPSLSMWLARMSASERAGRPFSKAFRSQSL